MTHQKPQADRSAEDARDAEIEAALRLLLALIADELIERIESEDLPVT